MVGPLIIIEFSYVIMCSPTLVQCRCNTMPLQLGTGRLTQARASAMLRLEGGLRLVNDELKAPLGLGNFRFSQPV